MVLGEQPEIGPCPHFFRKVLHVSRQGFYQHLAKKERPRKYQPLADAMKEILEEIGISHHPRRKPNGITKADRESGKSEDLLKRDFHTEEPLIKCVTDITKKMTTDELKALVWR